MEEDVVNGSYPVCEHWLNDNGYHNSDDETSCQESVTTTRRIRSILVCLRRVIDCGW